MTVAAADGGQVSPDSFSIQVSVPGDPRLIGVVRGLCAHAAGYARLAEADGASLIERVAAAAERAATARPNLPCPLLIDCAGGELRVTVGGETFSQPLPA